jgi:hypothetical protein
MSLEMMGMPVIMASTSAPLNPSNLEGNTKQLDKARLKEIMEFDEMPKKSYTEIVSEMKDQFNIYYENLTKLRNNIKKVKQLFKKV